MVLAWKSRRPVLCLLEFRSEEKEPLDISNGGLEIKFVLGAELTWMNNMANYGDEAKPSPLGRLTRTCNSIRPLGEPK
jgi:hypothetical protein